MSTRLTRREFLKESAVAFGAAFASESRLGAFAENPLSAAFQKVTDTLTKYISTREANKQAEMLRWFDGATIAIVATPIREFKLWTPWSGERGIIGYDQQMYSDGAGEMTTVLVQKGQESSIFLQSNKGEVKACTISRSGSDTVGINTETGKIALTVDEGNRVQVTGDGASFNDLTAMAPGKELSYLGGKLIVDGGKLTVKPHPEKNEEEYNTKDPMAIFHVTPMSELTFEQGIYMSALKAFGFPPLLPPIPQALWLSADKPTTIFDLNTKTVQAQDNQKKPVATAIFDASKKSWTWKEVEIPPPTFRELCNMKNLTFATAVDRKYLNGATYKEKIRSIANQLVIAYELDTREVFEKFAIKDWKEVLTDWGAIKQSLSNGIIPSKMDALCSWAAADDLLKFASDEEHGGKNKMKIRAQHLMWGADVPTSLVDAYKKRELTRENILTLAEFMVKVRVAKYKGKIKEWDVADEVMQHKRYRKVAPQTAFWLDTVGDDVTDKVSGWTQEVDPDATQCWIEDHLLQPDVFPEVLADLRTEMKHIKDAKLPIKKVGSENNFWWKNPPKKTLMIKVLNEIKAAGFEITSAETNVNIGPVDLVTDRRPVVVEPTDPLAAQAVIYDDTLNAYIQAGGEAGVTQISDLDSWYNSYGTEDSRLTRAMMLDERLEPKPAYTAMYNRLRAA